MRQLDASHDPALRSWVESANDGRSDFPIQNLPFAVFRPRGTMESFRGGVAIGDQVLDLRAVASLGLASGLAARALGACTSQTLNPLMALGPSAWSALRATLQSLLRAGASQAPVLARALLPQAAVEHGLPAAIGNYTDFYASIHHATAVGRLFRPDNPLLPNYRWVPIAYHGRASSIGVSGQTIIRPLGQLARGADAAPVLGPSVRLDYELELGAFVGPGSRLGERVPLASAEDHLFGLCLLNDWSARDIQAWEAQPLGPFLAKSFATTISPWIVTMEALAPFRSPWSRSPPDPEPLAYLDAASVRQAGALDVELEVRVESQQMRAAGAAPHRLSHSNFRDSYWTLAQMLTHHTVNGCNLCPGDLLGTGTQSGPRPAEAGSLLELTAGGKQPLTLPSGEQRTFLADGDRVVLRAWCERAGRVRIGFGEAAGTVVPATPGG
ncbi:MAG TPA: fumarylacetoacetase [Steroidobacteraceae bacterium]|nr:fumarylacetoacetase [Steroidobacteraceae bacterium]